MIRLGFSHDIGAGLLVAAIGAAFIYWGLDLEFGSPAEMGPGFMPVVLGCAIALLGVVILIRGGLGQQEQVGTFNFRPLLFIVASVVAFALIVNRAGFIPATFVSTFLSTLATGRFRPIYSVTMAGAQTAAAVVIFVFGLGLPFRLWGA